MRSNESRKMDGTLVVQDDEPLTEQEGMFLGAMRGDLTPEETRRWGAGRLARLIEDFRDEHDPDNDSDSARSRLSRTETDVFFLAQGMFENIAARGFVS